jgi:hypothetical protein
MNELREVERVELREVELLELAEVEGGYTEYPWCGTHTGYPSYSHPPVTGSTSATKLW